MKAAVRRHADTREFDTAERCAILEVANDGDDTGVSIARARVAPGITTAWHRLVAVDERYLIVQGRGRAEVGGQPGVDVGPGDVVRIPAGCAQRIASTGDRDLIFYAICSPRFRPECYVALE